MKRQVIRGKMVRQGGVMIDTREDGSAHVKVADDRHLEGMPSTQELDLSEGSTLRLLDLLGDVVTYEDEDVK
jgi:hypothetical protein